MTSPVMGEKKCSEDGKESSSTMIVSLKVSQTRCQFYSQQHKTTLGNVHNITFHEVESCARDPVRSYLANLESDQPFQTRMRILLCQEFNMALKPPGRCCRYSSTIHH